ncbi:50S ribosomal protein L5 [Candidatus Shapirobacteria bacterium]|nr:MAG: 50S ribosomal protein L5 [Candidatus Shapirobacteria bacterium]
MLQQQFKQKIKKELWQKLSKNNINTVPVLKKVVINYRLPSAKESKELLINAETELMAISGQKARLCRAKKSEANFKLRQGDPLALKVTLRGRRMFDFVEKLFNLVLPRLRDFRGLSSNSFDDGANYNLVIKDQTYFPEINLDKVKKIRSVQISLVTSTSSKSDAKMLLSALGLPFKKE